MAINPLGLGKGLDALIRETSEARDPGGVQTLRVKDIQPNPNQPRRKFSEKALEELAASIASQGLLQPILARPLGPAHPGRYEIVAGERRWRACQLAGLTEIPVLVRSFSAQDTLAAALIENLQREDLNPIEESLGIQTLKDEFGLSQEDLAKRLGKSRSAIANSLRLLALPELFRKDLTDGRISAGHARSLLTITEPRAQEYLRNLILEEHLSVREAEGLAATWKETGGFLPEGSFSSGSSSATAATIHLGDGTSAEDPAALADPAAQGAKANMSSDVENSTEAAAEMQRDAAAAPAGFRKSRPQSALLLEVQSRIGAALSMSVRVTGKENKGKISLSYNSKEELDILLNRLSMLVLESRDLPALPTINRAALAGTEFEELAGTEREALERTEREALPGVEREALPGVEREALPGVEREALPGVEREALPGVEREALPGVERSALTGAGHSVLAAAPHREALSEGKPVGE